MKDYKSIVINNVGAIPTNPIIITVCNDTLIMLDFCSDVCYTISIEWKSKQLTTFFVQFLSTTYELLRIIS